MERGISRVTDNEILVNKARCQVEQDFNKATSSESSCKEELQETLPSDQDQQQQQSPVTVGKNFRHQLMMHGDSIETPAYTFTLPDITQYPGELLCGMPDLFFGL